MKNWGALIWKKEPILFTMITVSSSLAQPAIKCFEHWRGLYLRISLLYSELIIPIELLVSASTGRCIPWWLFLEEDVVSTCSKVNYDRRIRGWSSELVSLDQSISNINKGIWDASCSLPVLLRLWKFSLIVWHEDLKRKRLIWLSHTKTLQSTL